MDLIFSAVTSHQLKDFVIQKALFRDKRNRCHVVGFEDVEWRNNGYELLMEWRNVSYFDGEERVLLSDKKDKSFFNDLRFETFLFDKGKSIPDLYKMKVIRWKPQIDAKKKNRFIAFLKGEVE